MFTKTEEQEQEGMFFAENRDGAILLVTGKGESELVGGRCIQTFEGVLVKEGRSSISPSNALGRYSTTWNARRFERIHGNLEL